MIDTFRTVLNNWNAKATERQKLQHAYLVIVVVAVLAAGVISLLNPDQGHKVVLVALVAIGVYLANAVIWNLLQSALIAKLSSKPKQK